MSPPEQPAPRILVAAAAALAGGNAVIAAVLFAGFPLPPAQRARLALAFCTVGIPLIAAYLARLLADLQPGAAGGDAGTRIALLTRRSLATWALAAPAVAFVLAGVEGLSRQSVTLGAAAVALGTGVAAIAGAGSAAHLLLRPSRDDLAQRADAAMALDAAVHDLVAHVRSALEGLRACGENVAQTGGRARHEGEAQREGVRRASSALQRTATSVDAVEREVHVLAAFAASAFSATTEMTASLEELGRVAAELERAVAEASRDMDGIARVTSTAGAGLAELERAATTTRDGLAASAHRVARMERDAAAGGELAGAAARDAAAALALAGQAEHGITALRGAVHDAHERVGALGRRGADISAIAEFIADVAQRTNLLALNASIIAAQAGESGRPFAVVAEEIRDLASQLAASTTSIEELVEGVQAEVAATTGQIEAGDALAERGLLLARGARVALEKIERSAQQASLHAAAIGEATGAQAGATRHVRDLAERVDELARGFGAGVQALADAGARLRELGTQVESLTARVGAALLEQAGAGRQQVLSLSELEHVVDRMETAVAEHGSGAAEVRAELDRLSAAVPVQASIADELSDHARVLLERARALEDRIAAPSVQTVGGPVTRPGRPS